MRRKKKCMVGVRSTNYAVEVEERWRMRRRTCREGQATSTSRLPHDGTRRVQSRRRDAEETQRRRRRGTPLLRDSRYAVTEKQSRIAYG